MDMHYFLQLDDNITVLYIYIYIYIFILIYIFIHLYLFIFIYFFRLCNIYNNKKKKLDKKYKLIIIPLGKLVNHLTDYIVY